MSRAIKKRTNYNKKIQLVKNEVEKENKAINKIWTLEGITFIAFIATIISSYILFALSTWTQVSLIPKRNAQFSQYEVYQQARMQTFENFRKAWTEMRIGFGDFVFDCAQGTMTSTKLKGYYIINQQLTEKLKETTTSAKNLKSNSASPT